MEIISIARGRATPRTVMAFLLAVIGTSNIILPGSNAVSTIKDVPNQSVTRGSPAEFPWNVTLDGLTIVTVQWVKMPTTQLAVRTGSTFSVSSLYTDRVTNPSAENIILENVTDNDAGTYQCTVTLSDLTTIDDSADLEVLDPTTQPSTSAIMTTPPITTPPPGLPVTHIVAIVVSVGGGSIIVIVVAVVVWKKKTRVSQDLCETGKKSTAEKDKTPKTADETV